MAPGDATVRLAEAVTACAGLRFAGVMAWEGHTMAMAESAERRSEIVRACETLVETAEACRAAGLPVEIVSAGGTGTYLTSAGVAGITEVEAGGGIFGDVWYRTMGANVVPALALMAQVTSRPTPTRVIVDAGRKTIDPTASLPEVRDLETTGTVGLSAEHGTLNLVAPSDVAADRRAALLRHRLQRPVLPSARAASTASATAWWKPSGRSRRGGGCSNELRVTSTSCGASGW